MKKQVMAFVKPAKELVEGDLVLTSRGTVSEIEATECFGNSSKRPCIEVSLLQCGKKSSVVYLADENILVLE